MHLRKINQNDYSNELNKKQFDQWRFDQETKAKKRVKDFSETANAAISEAKKKGILCCLFLTFFGFADIAYLLFRLFAFGLPYEFAVWGVSLSIISIAAIIAEIVLTLIRYGRVHRWDSNLLSAIILGLPVFVCMIYFGVLLKNWTLFVSAGIVAVLILIHILENVFNIRKVKSLSVSFIAGIVLILLFIVFSMALNLGTVRLGRELFTKNIRNVEYTYHSETDSYSIKKVYWTVRDWLSGDEELTFVSEDGKSITGKQIIGVEKDAFNGIKSVRKVMLPSEVAEIEAGAFHNSGITDVSLFSTKITFDDDFEDTAVKSVRIYANDCKIDRKYTAAVATDIEYVVNADYVDKYRLDNRTISRHIVPDVGETQLYINYDFDGLPEELYKQYYIPTKISKKNSTGDVLVSLPWSSLVNTTEQGDKCWSCYGSDERLYRLFQWLVDGEEVQLSASEFPYRAKNNVHLYGEWKKGYIITTAYRLNGQKHDERLGVVFKGEGDFVLQELKCEGYTCNEWYSKDTYNANSRLSSVSDTITDDVVVYPAFKLDAPKLSTQGYEGVYDAAEHVISIAAAHEAKIMRYDYECKADDEVMYSTNEYPSEGSEGKFEYIVKNVADARTYTVTVTATDYDGRKSSITESLQVNIAPKQITVEWSELNFDYDNNSHLPTGTIVGVEQSDSVQLNVTGQQTDAGEYTATASITDENYVITDSTKTISFKINKIDYDIENVTFSDASFEYNGYEQYPVISGELPIGLDGIALQVEYVGAVKIVTAQTRVKAVFVTISNNYNTPEPLSANLTITKKSIAVVAKPQAVTYGEAETTLTYEADLLCADDQFSGALQRDAGDDTGTYTIRQGTLTAGNNYEIHFTEASYTIERAQAVINTSGVLKQYTYNGYLQTIDSGATLNHSECGLEYANNTFTTVQEGNALKVTVSSVQTRNYEAASAEFTVTVQKAKVAIPQANIGLIYNGEEQTGLEATDKFTVQNETGRNATNYTATVFLTDPDNYQWADVGFDGEVHWQIAQKTISVVAHDKSIVYGSEDVELTCDKDALCGEDTYSGTVVREAGSNAGVYHIQLGTLSAGDNYRIQFTGADYTIKRARAVINTTGVQTNYNYTGNLQTIDSGATLNHNECSLVYSSNTFTTVKEGNGLRVKISSNQTVNYEAASAEVVIAVTKATVATPTAMQNLIYNGYYQTGVQSSSLYSVSDGNKKNFGSYVASVTLIDPDNYCWGNQAFNGNIHWAIAKKAINVAAQSKTTKYGQELSLTYEADLLCADDRFSGALQRDAGIDTGTYTIRQGTLTAGDNYDIRFTEASYTIERAQAIINTGTVLKNYTYTGELQTIDSGATINHNECALVYSNNTFTTVQEGNGLRVQVSSEQTRNYESASAEFTITVQKATVAIPQAKTGLVYNGEAQTGLEATDKFTVQNGNADNAGNHEAQLQLNDTANYRWEREDFDGKISWEIARKKVAVVWGELTFEWDGDVKCPTAEVTIIGGSSLTLEVSGGTAQSGSHSATAAFSESFAERDNYELENAETAFTVLQEIELLFTKEDANE